MSVTLVNCLQPSLCPGSTATVTTWRRLQRLPVRLEIGQLLSFVKLEMSENIIKLEGCCCHLLDGGWVRMFVVVLFKTGDK